MGVWFVFSYHKKQVMKKIKYDSCDVKKLSIVLFFGGISLSVGIIFNMFAFG